MATVAEIKQERSDLKKKVTIAARRLNGSIERALTEDIIHKFASELDAVYSDFLGVHEEYEDLVNSDENLAEHRTVNGLNCEQYQDTVTEVYESAIKSFKLLQEKHAMPLLNDIQYLITSHRLDKHILQYAMSRNATDFRFIYF